MSLDFEEYTRCTETISNESPLPAARVRRRTQRRLLCRARSVAIPVPMMVVPRIVGVVAMMVAAVVAIKIRVFRGWRVSSSERTILSHGYRGSAHQQGR